MSLTRNEVIDRIAGQRRQEQFFIKTWEAGTDFVDFDLIDRFVTRSETESIIEKFELLDMKEMWQALIDLDPDKLALVQSSEGEVIEWTWSDSHGIEKKTVYPFTPEGIMKIIDDEFFV